MPEAVRKRNITRPPTIDLSGEPQNCEQELVSADLRRTGSASSAAVVERTHLLYDNAGTNETIQLNLRRAVGAMVRPCVGRIPITVARGKDGPTHRICV